jgi:hypothetical protein
VHSSWGVAALLGVIDSFGDLAAFSGVEAALPPEDHDDAIHEGFFHGADGGEGLVKFIAESFEIFGGFLEFESANDDRPGKKTVFDRIHF